MFAETISPHKDSFRLALILTVLMISVGVGVMLPLRDSALLRGDRSTAPIIQTPALPTPLAPTGQVEESRLGEIWFPWLKPIERRTLEVSNKVETAPTLIASLALTPTLEASTEPTAVQNRQAEQVAAAATPCAPAAPLGWSFYRVRSGDTLWQLAQRGQVTVQRIQQVNCLASSQIVTGQRLTVPASSIVLPTASPTASPTPTLTQPLHTATTIPPTGTATATLPPVATVTATATATTPPVATATPTATPSPTTPAYPAP